MPNDRVIKKSLADIWISLPLKDLFGVPCFLQMRVEGRRRFN